MASIAQPIPIRPTIEEDGPNDEHTREPFVMVPTATGETILATLGTAAFGVYWHLLKRSHNNQCHPSIDDIAEGTAMSRRHVIRMLNDLERDGWIYRQKRHTKRGMSASTLYTLLGCQGRTNGGDSPQASHGHTSVVNVTRTKLELDNVTPPISPKRKSPLTDVPDDFTVTPEMRQWAKDKHHLGDFEIDARTDHFLLYVGKVGKQYAKWDLAWKDAMTWERTTAANQNGTMPPEIASLPHNHPRRESWQRDHQKGPRP